MNTTLGDSPGARQTKLTPIPVHLRTIGVTESASATLPPIPSSDYPSQ